MSKYSRVKELIDAERNPAAFCKKVGINQSFLDVWQKGREIKDEKLDKILEVYSDHASNISLSRKWLYLGEEPKYIEISNSQSIKNEPKEQEIGFKLDGCEPEIDKNAVQNSVANRQQCQKSAIPQQISEKNDFDIEVIIDKIMQKFVDKIDEKAAEKPVEKFIEKKITKIIVCYDNGTFEELKN